MSRGEMTRTLGKRRSTLTVRPSGAAAQAEVDHREMLPDQGRLTVIPELHRSTTPFID